MVAIQLYLVEDLIDLYQSTLLIQANGHNSDKGNYKGFQFQRIHRKGARWIDKVEPDID